jgi:APA family basic amino acid/polyamine antiporter
MPSSAPPAAARLGRSLSAFDLTLLGVGAIIGGGIFASVGTAALGDAERLGAGPSLTLSIVLTAGVCAITALSYSELAARLPSAGSAYAYARAAFGPRLAWTVGWCLTLEYAVANVAVAISWGNYAASLLQMAVPAARSAVWGGQSLGPWLGALCILGLTASLLWGTRQSSRLNNFLVVFKVAILLGFVGLGLAACAPSRLWANWHPYMPNGWSGTLYGAATMFFSFIGFDSVATAAEETRRPQRSIPIAICGSLALCALLYMGVAGILTGLAPLPELSARLGQGSSQPLLCVLSLLGAPGAMAQPLLALGALIAQTTALLAFQLAQARIFFAMGRDGLLPRSLARVHPRSQAPHVATLAAGGLVAAGCLSCRLEPMLDLADIGTLFIFCLANLSLPYLRRQQRAAGQPAPRFRVPFGDWFCPMLGCGSCLVLMFCLPLRAWLALGCWLSLGEMLQWAFNRRR